MLAISSRVTWLRSVAVFVAGLFCVTSSWSETAAQNPHPGRVVGHIDGIRFEGEQFNIRGWACQQEAGESISVHVYADHSAYDTPAGVFVLAAMANLESEPAVNEACQDRKGGRHRFDIALPNQLLTAFEGRRLYIQGIRIAGGVQNAAIAGSGTIRFPGPSLARAGGDPYPPLSGAYKNSPQHPRVFTTQADLQDLATRINSKGSFSAQSFGRLAARIENDLASNIDWDATYSGCDIDIYLHAFSYEPRDGYSNEVRTEDQLRATMNGKPGMAVPAGAAPVASRLALYAALVRAGAITPPDAPSADQVAALAKRILLAWAGRGFRDHNGNILSKAEQFCDGQGRVDHFSENGVGLQIGRGVVNSVHAQDLLESIGALDATDAAKLRAFHTAMFDLIREASNFRAALPELNHPETACERYSNHVGAHLIALLSIARLLDDGRKFNAIISGADNSIPLAISWVSYFNHAVYGKSDRPIGCYRNPGPDSLTSHPSFQTSIVAPGEIEDRYRNANPAQGIGYPAGLLGGLFTAAEVLRIAGFDMYGYRGAHRQSIEMATEYYACLAKYVGFKNTVTADNTRACPNYQQYIGKVVNGVDPDVVIGAYRFPENAAITSLETAAKVAWSTGPFSLDAIHFGKWRD